MKIRKESEKRIVFDDGIAGTFRLLDGLTIEDLVVQMAHERAWREITKQNRAPKYERDVRDYLIRLRVLDLDSP